jgi:hypothetical protein
VWAIGLTACFVHRASEPRHAPQRLRPRPPTRWRTRWRRRRSTRASRRR